MSEKVEQRICIKFCQRLGDTCLETYAKLQIVYGEECMSRTQVYDWYRRFQYGRRSVDSDERSGRPATSRTNKNIADVLEALKRNRKITIRKLSKDVNISYGSVQSIITEDLDIKREPAKVAKMSGTVKNKPATPKKAALKSANSPAKSSVVKPEEASEESGEAETRQETNSEESYQKVNDF